MEDGAASRGGAPASVEVRLRRLLELPRLLTELRGADASGADVSTCLEASRLRAQHDALTPALARALLRTGVWQRDDLRRFLAGCSAPGAAALIASACCEVLGPEHLDEVLHLIEAEGDVELAAQATRGLVAHCLRTDHFDLAERAVDALAARAGERPPGSDADWLTTALAVHERLHGHGDAKARMAALPEGPPRELFDEWVSGARERWRAQRPLESEEAARREALLAVLKDPLGDPAGARGSALERLGERRARRRALDAVLSHARATDAPGMLFRAAASMPPGRRRRALVREAIALRERRAGAGTGVEGPAAPAIGETPPPTSTTHDPILAWLTEAGLFPAPAETEGDAMAALAASHHEIGAHLLRQLEHTTTGTDEARAGALCRIAPFLHAPEHLDAAIDLAAGLGAAGAWAHGHARHGAAGIGGATGLTSALAPRLTREALLRALDLSCLSPAPPQESWYDLRKALEGVDRLPDASATALTTLARRAPDAVAFPEVLLRLTPAETLKAASLLPPEQRSVLLAGAAADASLSRWTERQRIDLLRRSRQCTHARELLELRVRPPRSENGLLAALESLNPRLVPTTRIAPVLSPLLDALPAYARLRVLERARRLSPWLRVELLPLLLERTLAADGDVLDGARRQLRALLPELCGDHTVRLGRLASDQVVALGPDLLDLSSSQLLRLVDRLAPDAAARGLRALGATLLERAEQDPSALDLVPVAARLPGFDADVRAARLLETWLKAQAESSREAEHLPQAAWDCLDLDALERLELAFRQRATDPTLPLPGLLFANWCRRCWVERSPRAVLERIEQALGTERPLHRPLPELAALEAVAEFVDEDQLGRYLDLYRLVWEAPERRPTLTGFAAIVRRGLRLGRSMEEVLSWTAFAPEAQQLEVVLPLLDELAERDLVELWHWQLGRPHSRPVVTGADRASPFAEAVRLLAGTLQRLGPEDGRSLWQEAGRRAPELDEDACLALLCAFLPQLTREQGPSAVTTLVQGFEEIVAEATRAALAARSARR